MHDLVIRGGTVIDGTGAAGFTADVGIAGGLIVEVGRIAARGAREFDAEGRLVTPGFVDGHTHYDAQLHWDPLAKPSCWQGITTAVIGNCGFSLAPVRRGEEALVVRNLERAEDISPAALAQGIDWRWETFPELMDAMDAAPKGINYACNIGHSALRTWAMGERAFGEAASDDDLARMTAQVTAAVRAGAVGFTSSRSGAHETSDDRPVPSRFAEWSEYEALARVTGAAGGMLELAIPFEGRSPDPAVRAPVLDRLKRIAVGSRAPFTFGLMPDGAGVFRDHLALLDAAAAEGGTMFGQAHSRGLTILLSFDTVLPFDRLPEWKPIRALPRAQQLRALADPAVKARLVHAAHHGDYGRAVGAEPPPPDWSVMRIYERSLPPNPLVRDRAAALGVDPVALMIDLAVESGFAQMFITSYGAVRDEDLEEIMRHPRTVMTFSDAGAHVGQIVDACIQTHLLAWWSRDRARFTVEEAVRMVTHDPARAWGFHDRGLVRPGMVADLNVIDLAALDPGMPELVHDLPGGDRRLEIRATGYDAAIVAGELLLERGAPTGALPGRLIRRGH